MDNRGDPVLCHFFYIKENDIQSINNYYNYIIGKFIRFNR